MGAETPMNKAKKATATSQLASEDQIDVGRLPNRQQSTAHFDAVADQIVRGWMSRRVAIDPPEKPLSWFKRNMYRLIKAYVDAGREQVFMKMATRSGRSMVGVGAIQSNAFKLALFAMWSDNQSLSRHQQRVFGNQMLYAYLHGVSPKHLIGFIRAAGSAQTIADKLKSGAREPGFAQRSVVTATNVSVSGS